MINSMGSKDDRLYTINALLIYTKERIKILTDLTSASKATDDNYHIAETRQRFIADCPYGDEHDKIYVKQMIRQILTESNNAKAPNFPNDYRISQSTIDKFIPWNNPKVIDPYILFLAIFYHYKEQYQANTLGYLIEKYGFNQLRDRGGLNGVGFYVSDLDVRHMWRTENISMSYEAKFEVLLQLIYEESFGNSVLDEIIYQNVGDISAGVSGVPEATNVTSANAAYPAFKSYWVRYKGSSIHFMFPSFGSIERLREVVKQLVGYKMKGEFSQKEGFKLGYGKDNSRRTAAMDPFGESPAVWVRKFTESQASNEQLYGGIKGYELVMAAERALVRGGATIPVCGAQGSGKTTKLEVLTEYIQNYYSIRVLESEFEAHLRWKYPLKNIFTMEANDTSPVSPSDAYNFSLRSAGDIYIIGEARSDDMIINVTRTANRGGRSVLFTFHPKTADMTIPEIANAMIREKMYVNLKDAIATALNTVKVCIFVTVDIETHEHFYEIFEFVPRPNQIPSDFLTISDREQREVAFMKSIQAYMQTMASADTYYDTIPIVVYDKAQKSYVMKNTVSDKLYEELMAKTPREEERLELARTFRPLQFIEMCAKKDHAFMSLGYIEEMRQKYALNETLLNQEREKIKSIATSEKNTKTSEDEKTLKEVI